MCMVLFVRSIAAYDGISDMPVCVGVHWHKCVQASGAGAVAVRGVHCRIQNVQLTAAAANNAQAVYCVALLDD